MICVRMKLLAGCPETPLFHRSRFCHYHRIQSSCLSVLKRGPFREAVFVQKGPRRWKNKEKYNHALKVLKMPNFGDQ